MTVERIPGDDTGIYKFDRVKVSGNKDIAEYLKAYAAANDLGNRLDRLKAGARAILKAHGFDEWPIIIEYQEPIECQGDTITGGRTGPPESAPPIVHDAHDLILYVRLLREKLDANDADKNDIAFLAYTVGTLSERVYVRVFEPFAKTGQKIKRATSEGGKQRAAHYRARRPQYQPEVDRIMNRNPSISYNRACEIAAKKFGCHPKTIKRHTRNPHSYPTK